MFRPSRPQPPLLGDGSGGGGGGGGEKAATNPPRCRLRGFGGECLEYPLPYGPGQWPASYNYSGAFPEGFVFGMATSAYQIEGAFREDGRGASIWDTFTGANTVGMPGATCSYCCKNLPCPVNPSMSDIGATGNVACDHYHAWRSDLAMMRSMGLKHYRFSISWPRLIPTGRLQDGVNEKAKAFYNSLIDGLLDAGITPYVTLYHWDLPQGLLDPPRVQGWWSRDENGRPTGQLLPDWLAYVETCFSEFGDRVKFWITFNEPWTFLYLGSGWGHAPGIPYFSDMSVDPWIAGHNVLNAHAAAVDLYRRKFQKHQNGKIGISNNCDWREPKTGKHKDIAAAERAVEFQLGWFSDPIFGKTGDYPPAMRRLYGARLPNFTAKERRLLKGSADFFGLNHYGTAFVSDAPDNEGADRDFANFSHSPDQPRAASSWLYGAGWGLRKIVNWVSRRYGRPPIYLMEGGWSLPKASSADEEVADNERVLYYANYTSELRKAVVEDKVDVRGYFAWSLMDNFEWADGYRPRFGTTYVDFALGSDWQAPHSKNLQPTAGKQWRRRRDSSCWLEALWRGGALLSPSGPDFRGCVNSSVFVRSFANDAHPGCSAQISLGPAAKRGSAAGGQAGSISGARAARPGGACDGISDVTWGPLPATFSGGSVLADFSEIGGPPQLAGYWDDAADAIEWGDGSRWVAHRRGATGEASAE